jgi:pimeloyl-ACP methyl ester carboxylesterase
MKTQFITLKDGTRIAYDIAGGGPSLMMLHGAGKTRRDWHTVGYVERLKRDFTVITVDIRGTGESDKRFNVSDYAIRAICQDITSVADACEVQQFGIWGFSFGGNIARYLGAWSDRVTAIAVIGVPFGPAVDKNFDRYIADLESKWGPSVRAYNEGKLKEKERKGIEKRQLAVWLPCFQAMRDWPDIKPGDIHCPTMLLVGTKNKDTMNWVGVNHEVLSRAGTRVETIQGLTHSQEFSEINQVFPVVSTFLSQNLR